MRMLGSIEASRSLLCGVPSISCRSPGAGVAFAAKEKFPCGNLQGRAPAALRSLSFEKMVPEVGVEPTRF
jgi:hypothetical protein